MRECVCPEAWTMHRKVRLTIFIHGDIDCKTCSDDRQRPGKNLYRFYRLRLAPTHTAALTNQSVVNGSSNGYPSVRTCCFADRVGLTGM